MKDSNEIASKGMANHNVGWSFSSPSEEKMQFFYDVIACSWKHTGITAAVTSPIITTDSGEGGNRRLHSPPFFQNVAQAGLQNHGRAVLTRAMDLKPHCSNIHKPTRFWIPAGDEVPRNKLIQPSCGDQQEHPCGPEKQQTQEWASM
jgi:hypothetical protein